MPKKGGKENCNMSLGLQFVMSNARVGKGYDNEPAVKFNEQGTYCTFQLAVSEYDKTAPNNAKWINIPVKCINAKLIERIQKCNLNEGSVVNALIKIDSDTYTDKNQKKKTVLVYVLKDFELTFASKPKESVNNGQAQGYAQPAQNNVYQMQGQGQYQGQMPPQNTGYPPQATQYPQQTPPVAQQQNGLPANFTVLPNGAPPATPPVAPQTNGGNFATPVGAGNGFTGYQPAGQAMGIPNGDNGFFGGGGFSEG